MHYAEASSVGYYEDADHIKCLAKAFVLEFSSLSGVRYVFQIIHSISSSLSLILMLSWTTSLSSYKRCCSDGMNLQKYATTCIKNHESLIIILREALGYLVTITTITINECIRWCIVCNKVIESYVLLLTQVQSCSVHNLERCLRQDHKWLLRSVCFSWPDDIILANFKHMHVDGPSRTNV